MISEEKLGIWVEQRGSLRASRGPEVNSEGMEAEPHVCPEIAQL